MDVYRCCHSYFPPLKVYLGLNREDKVGWEKMLSISRLSIVSIHYDKWFNSRMGKDDDHWYRYPDIYGLRSLVPNKNSQFTYWEKNIYNLSLKTVQWQN